MESDRRRSRASLPPGAHFSQGKDSIYLPRPDVPPQASCGTWLAACAMDVDYHDQIAPP